MRRTTVVAVLATGVLAFVAAGCGGSDDPSASDATTVEETMTATSEDTTEAMEATETTDTESDETTDALPNLADLSDECKQLVALSSEFSKAFGAVSGDASLGDASEAFESFVDKVPDEIRDDFRVLADAFAKYADAFKDIDLSSGETPSAETLAKLQEIVQGLDQAEVQAASDRISTWSTENCAP